MLQVQRLSVLAAAWELAYQVEFTLMKCSSGSGDELRTAAAAALNSRQLQFGRGRLAVLRPWLPEPDSIDDEVGAAGASASVHGHAGMLKAPAEAPSEVPCRLGA